MTDEHFVNMKLNGMFPKDICEVREKDVRQH